MPPGESNSHHTTTGSKTCINSLALHQRRPHHALQIRTLNAQSVGSHIIYRLKSYTFSPRKFFHQFLCWHLHSNIVKELLVSVAVQRMKKHVFTWQCKKVVRTRQYMTIKEREKREKPVKILQKVHNNLLKI